MESADQTQTKVHTAVYTRSYRFYPLYLEGFLKSVCYTLYGLALPSYLLFQRHISSDLLGVIIAVFYIAYIFGPSVCKNLSSQIGTRSAHYLAALVSIFCVGLQLVSTTPVMLILFRFIDGICLGFFWPNAYSQISKWQAISPQTKGDEYFKRFSVAWNLGNVAAEILGFLLVFLYQNNFIAFVVAWILMLFQVPAALLLEKPQVKFIFINNEAVVLIKDPKPSRWYDFEKLTSIQNFDEISPAANPTPIVQNPPQKVEDINLLLARFPMGPVFLGMFVVQGMIALQSFTYRYYLLEAQSQSAFLYFIMLGSQILQMAAITYSGHQAPIKKYHSFMWTSAFSLLIYLLLFFLFNIDLTSLMIIFIGVVTGFNYGFITQVMLEHGKVYKTTKFSVLFETMSGLGNGIMPLMAGLIAGIDVSSFRINNLVLFGLILVLFLFNLLWNQYTLRKHLETPHPA